MKAYQPLEQKDPETGLWYKVWDIPEGLPVSPDLVFVAPDESLEHPKWDPTKGMWVEDEDSVLSDLRDKIVSLEKKLTKFIEGDSTAPE